MIVLAVIYTAVWLYLVLARGGFWLDAARESGAPSPAAKGPTVAALIPARNEAEYVGESVSSLLRQDYAGEVAVIVVDDDSADETAAVASQGAGTVVRSRGLPGGWTGKLWALQQGILAAERVQPEYLLLTDADIVHAPDTLSWLVAQALSGSYVLTSLMAKLRCESLAERSHVPAFVYFFQMLFPFGWVCRYDKGVAAAAGGCMLVRTDALANIGGVGVFRRSLTDDCAWAARLKGIGPIWLGLTERACSIRRYDRLRDVKRVIARCAYAQLDYSPLWLPGAGLGLALAFLAPPLFAIFAEGLPRYLGFAAWLAMALSFLPPPRFFPLSPPGGHAPPT